MVKKKIGDIVDTECTLIYSTDKEFQSFYRRTTGKHIEDFPKPSPRGACGILKKSQNKKDNDGFVQRRSYYIWVNSEGQPRIEDRIGTLAHETQHYIDRLGMDLSKRGEPLACMELTARIVQTIVRQGAIIMLEEDRKKELR